MLSGGAGEDVFRGGPGADTIDGGAGNDTVDYSGSTAGVTVDLTSGGPQTGGEADSDVLTGITGVNGSGADDNITGGGGSNVLSGGAGADTLDGGAGADTIDGGPGNDLLIGGAGGDRIVLGDGADTVRGSAADLNGDTIVGFGADDHLVIEDFDPAKTKVALVGSPAGGVTIDIDGDGNVDATLVVEAAANGALTVNDDGELVFVPAQSGGSDQTDQNQDQNQNEVEEEEEEETGETIVINTNNEAVELGPEDGTDDIDTVVTKVEVKELPNTIENIQIDSTADTETKLNELDNVATGGGGANTFSGLEGDDTLNGGNDNDLIYGNQDDDSLMGDAGEDTMYGGFDNDTYALWQREPGHPFRRYR